MKIKFTILFAVIWSILMIVPTSIQALSIAITPWSVWSFTGEMKTIPSGISLKKIDPERTGADISAEAGYLEITNQSNTPLYIAKKVADYPNDRSLRFDEGGNSAYPVMLQNGKVYQHEYEVIGNKAYTKYIETDQISYLIDANDLMQLSSSIRPEQKLFPDSDKYFELRPADYQPPEPEIYQLPTYFGNDYHPIQITITYQLNPFYQETSESLSQSKQTLAEWDKQNAPWYHKVLTYYKLGALTGLGLLTLGVIAVNKRRHIPGLKTSSKPVPKKMPSRKQKKNAKPK